MEISGWIWATVWAVELGWAARLWQLGLVRGSPFLTSYLIFAAVHSIANFAACHAWGQNSVASGWLWTAAQPVLWMMLFCVVIEACNHILKGYEGLQRLGQLGLNVALGTVALIVVVMVVLSPPVDGASSSWGISWIRQERSVYLALTAIYWSLVIVGACHGWVVARNIATVFAVFSLFFLSQAGLLVIRDHPGAQFWTIGYTLVPILYIVWGLAGAFVLTRVGGERSDEETDARRVMHQARQHIQPGGLRV